jgi:plastocyanin
MESNLQKVRNILVVIGLALVAILPFVAFGGSSAEAASATIKVRAGGGEPGYSVNLFLPNAATITTGDVVHWDSLWSEPHTVTIGAPPTGADPTANPSPFPTAPVVYNGTGYVSSGFIATGFSQGPPGSPSVPSSFEIQFTKAGTYNIFCAIHPNMTQVITVVDSGTVSKQADLDAAGTTKYTTELAAIKAVAATANKPATVTKQADGSNLYTLVVGAETQNAEAMQYFPPTLNVTQGDSVTWQSNVHEPHTVTFPPPPAGDPFAATQDKFPSGYNGGPANSAIIGIDEPAGTSFTLKFNKAGTYTYFCLLHVQEGMTGQVVVAAAAVPPATPTVVPGAPKTGSGFTSTAGDVEWLTAMAGLLFVASGLAVFAVRRR